MCKLHKTQAFQLLNAWRPQIPGNIIRLRMIILIIKRTEKYCWPYWRFSLIPFFGLFKYKQICWFISCFWCVFLQKTHFFLIMFAHTSAAVADIIPKDIISKEKFYEILKNITTSQCSFFYFITCCRRTIFFTCLSKNKQIKNISFFN